MNERTLLNNVMLSLSPQVCKTLLDLQIRAAPENTTMGSTVDCCRCMRNVETVEILVETLG
jgi:hypothetical protein